MIGSPSIGRVLIVQQVQVGQHGPCSADIDMGVDFGRAQIRMAEHLLKSPRQNGPCLSEPDSPRFTEQTVIIPVQRN
jgi:hypothetical protein